MCGVRRCEGIEIWDRTALGLALGVVLVSRRGLLLMTLVMTSSVTSERAWRHPDVTLALWAVTQLAAPPKTPRNSLKSLRNPLGTFRNFPQILY